MPEAPHRVEFVVQEEEARLVEGLRRRDERAWATLVASYANRLLRFTSGRLNNKEDAEDVVQETFMAVSKAIHTFRSNSSLSTWIYRIALNKTADRIRKRRPGHDSLETVPEETLAVERGGDPLRERDLRVQCFRRGALRAFIASLTAEHRLLVRLREVEDLEWSEIALRIGKPSGGACRTEWCRDVRPKLDAFRKRVDEEIERDLRHQDGGGET